MRVLRLFAIAGVPLACCGCQPRSTRMEPTPPIKAATKAAPPEPLPTCVCYRAASPITVDGVANEWAWSKAGMIGPFVQWNGQPAASSTVAGLVWDDTKLYLVVECADADIQGTMKQRDESLWEENEVVELFADAGGDGGCYLEFEVNPLNTVVDLVIPKAGAPGPIEGKKMWDAKGMKTAVHTLRPGTPNGWWSVEMSIPLDCFLDAPNTPPKPGDEWRVNLYRVDAVGDQVEYQAWSPTNTPEPSFHVPDRFGTLRFEGKAEESRGKS